MRHKAKPHTAFPCTVPVEVGPRPRKKATQLISPEGTMPPSLCLLRFLLYASLCTVLILLVFNLPSHSTFRPSHLVEQRTTMRGSTPLLSRLENSMATASWISTWRIREVRHRVACRSPIPQLKERLSRVTASYRSALRRTRAD
jgi:hypothetical protein